MKTRVHSYFYTQQQQQQLIACTNSVYQCLQIHKCGGAQIIQISPPSANNVFLRIISEKKSAWLGSSNLDHKLSCYLAHIRLFSMQSLLSFVLNQRFEADADIFV